MSDMSTSVSTLEKELHDEMAGFVVRYIGQFSLAPNLGILARRFGKRCKRFGFGCEAFMLRDPRFIMTMLESGKTTIYASLELDPE